MVAASHYNCFRACAHIYGAFIIRTSACLDLQSSSQVVSVMDCVYYTIVIMGPALWFFLITFDQLYLLLLPYSDMTGST